MMSPGLALAKVTAVHPGGLSVDLRMHADGSPASNVQVMCGSISTNTGFADLPAPDPSGTPDNPMALSGTRDMTAVVGFVSGVPLVLGFLPQQICQMTFEDGRMVYRHQSDAYITIDAAANMEIVHPGGTFIRVGTGAAHDDLTGKDFDGKWALAKNTGTQANVFISTGGATLLIEPSGKITATGTEALLQMASKVTLDAPMTHVTGQLVVDQLLTYKGGMNGSGGSGGASAVIDGSMLMRTGSITVPSGDVVASNISLTGHHHTDPQGGNTGGPA